MVPPTRAPALARARLRSLPCGGGTPLADGLRAALQVCDLARRRGEGISRIRVVVISDGNANIPLHVSDEARDAPREGAGGGGGGAGARVPSAPVGAPSTGATWIEVDRSRPEMLREVEEVAKVLVRSKVSLGQMASPDPDLIGSVRIPEIGV